MQKEPPNSIESKLSVLLKETAKIRRRVVDLETYISEAFSKVFGILLKGSRSLGSIPELYKCKSPSPVEGPSPVGSDVSSLSKFQGSKGKLALQLKLKKSSALKTESKQNRNILKFNLNNKRDAEKLDDFGVFDKLKEKNQEKTTDKPQSKSPKKNQMYKRRQAQRGARLGDPLSCSISPYSKNLQPSKTKAQKLVKDKRKTKNLGKRVAYSKNKNASICRSRLFKKYEPKSMNILRIKQRSNILKKNLNNVNSRIDSIKRTAEDLKSKLSESFQDQMDFLDELSWDLKAFEEHEILQKTPVDDSVVFNHPKAKYSTKREIPQDISVRHEVWQNQKRRQRGNVQASGQGGFDKRIPSLIMDSEFKPLPDQSFETGAHNKVV